MFEFALSVLLGIADVVILARDQGHDLGPDIVVVAGLTPIPDLALRDAHCRDQGHGPARVHAQGPALQLHGVRGLARVPAQKHHENRAPLLHKSKNQHRQSQNRMETSNHDIH